MRKSGWFLIAQENHVRGGSAGDAAFAFKGVRSVVGVLNMGRKKKLPVAMFCVRLVGFSFLNVMFAISHIAKHIPVLATLLLLLLASFVMFVVPSSFKVYVMISSFEFSDLVSFCVYLI